MSDLLSSTNGVARPLVSFSPITEMDTNEGDINVGANLPPSFSSSVENLLASNFSNILESTISAKTEKESKNSMGTKSE